MSDRITADFHCILDPVPWKLS